MSPNELKNRLVRPAVALTRGNSRPSYRTTKSWLGRAYLHRPGETLPLDAQGQPMWPLLQLVLAGLPWVPGCLASTQALTVFVSRQFPRDTRAAPNGQYWLLREYPLGEALRMSELTATVSPLRPFALQAEPVLLDYPVWDDKSIPEGLSQEIAALERAGSVGEDEEWLANYEGHKLGGWPSFCQPSITFDPGFEFVLQIASDSKAKFNVVDAGTLFLAKNATTGAWLCYCDFH
jgi:hypothetical protein